MSRGKSQATFVRLERLAYLEKDWPNSLNPDKRILGGIVVALIVWAVYHAVGAYRLNHNPWRAVIVLACMGGFLGFWWLMLHSRQRRLRKRDSHRDANQG